MTKQDQTLKNENGNCIWNVIDINVASTDISAPVWGFNLPSNETFCVC